MLQKDQTPHLLLSARFLCSASTAAIQVTVLLLRQHHCLGGEGRGHGHFGVWLGEAWPGATLVFHEQPGEIPLCPQEPPGCESWAGLQGAGCGELLLPL